MGHYSGSVRTSILLRLNNFSTCRCRRHDVARWQCYNTIVPPRNENAITTAAAAVEILNMGIGSLLLYCMSVPPYITDYNSCLRERERGEPVKILVSTA